MAAKNNASEKALRDIIIQRMLQSPKAQALKPGVEGPQLPSAGMNCRLSSFCFGSCVLLLLA